MTYRFVTNLSGFEALFFSDYVYIANAVDLYHCSILHIPNKLFVLFNCVMQKKWFVCSCLMQQSPIMPFTSDMAQQISCLLYERAQYQVVTSWQRCDVLYNAFTLKKICSWNSLEHTVDHSINSVSLILYLKAILSLFAFLHNRSTGYWSSSNLLYMHRRHILVCLETVALCVAHLNIKAF